MEPDAAVSTSAGARENRATEMRVLGDLEDLADARRDRLRWSCLGKRLTDVVLASVLIVILFPFLLAISLAIVLDSRGPVLFIQRRRGLGYRGFLILKFRTLRHGESDPHEHYEMLSQDSRITRVGAFLRRTSLDELPQLLNVLAGSMSLVGPRPLVEWESEYSLKRHRDRFLVKPGITGWQQITGRNANTLDIRLDRDIEYVGAWNLRWDLRILIGTIPFLLRDVGVYPH